jgi:hypothetical protein
MPGVYFEPIQVESALLYKVRDVECWIASVSELLE